MDQLTESSDGLTNDLEMLRKWEEFSRELACVKGPLGVTMENTIPDSLFNGGLINEYLNLKNGLYTPLLGDRIRPKTNEHDVFVGISKKDDRSSLAGYSFFVEQKPTSYDSDLHPMVIAHMQFLETKRNFSAPVIYRRGGINVGYSQFLAATVVRSVISQVNSPKIDLHVICRGYKENSIVDTDLTKLQLNPNFIKAISKEVKVGITRRICIWIEIYNHIFMIVLDSTKASDDSDVEHKIYSADSVDYTPASVKILTVNISMSLSDCLAPI